MKEKEFVRNAFGCCIRKCCASCKNRKLLRTVSQRMCTKHEMEVRSDYVCSLWAMSQQMKAAGCSRGKVKRKEYLLYVFTTRRREMKAEQRGETVVEKSIAELRSEFEEQYGSIYVEM